MATNTTTEPLPVPHPYWVQTFGGHAFDLMVPSPDRVRLATVAHQLARICRFNGATAEHYSVAQHCVHVAQLVPAAFGLRALLHDAHEAYLHDLSGPLLALLHHHNQGHATVLDFYKDLADKAIGTAFGCELLHQPSPLIVRADALMLAVEKRDLLEPEPQPWPRLPTLAEVAHIKPITPWSYTEARERFLHMFDLLGGTP